MAKSVALLLGVHAHQPVGNFTHVLDDAHQRCYGPFIRVLYHYPEFKFAIHYSGWLLDYLIQHYPQDMQMLQEMVARGQTELFGAGYTEPVLAAIPSKDRIGQITQLSQYLQKKLGQTPKGAWLTERVWESNVVPGLADAGINYVTVDDYHFLCTGKQPDQLNGYYTTEEDGRKLDLFPISEPLRYRLPFSPAQDVVSYMESLADDTGRAAAVYFDDIEKFGIWPETYEWVYEKGWLKGFIEGVLKSPVIRTMLYSEYHASAPTRGVVYLPTASYSEMNEWTLPVPAAHFYADMVDKEKREGRWEQNKPFVRGGIWRNFFMRYPESNWMHKRMLNLSERYHALDRKQQRAPMLHLLYEAQANDAYWHGLFGGFYLPHLRRAIFNAIVGLEALLDEVSARPVKTQIDLDLDGHDEIFLQNGHLQAVVSLDGSASIREFDSYKLHHNFGDTLARQQEHYHRKVHTAHEHEQHGGEGIANPHERMVSKHEIAVADMHIDEYAKTIFRDSWQANAQAPLQAVVYQLADNKGKTPVLAFAGAFDGFVVTKKISLKNKLLRVEYVFDKSTTGLFNVELNLAMPSCDGVAGRFRVGGHVPGGFGQALHIERMKEVLLEDDVLGGIVTITSEATAVFNAFPHFSVSQSEAGFEKIMQALTMTLSWDLKKNKTPIVIELEIS